MPSARSLSLASSILLLPHLAVAQTSAPENRHREMRLSWVRSEAAASCPDAGHVEADVEQRLGWSPFIRSSAASESIEALVSRDNDVWRAAIELRAADGTSIGSRTVESPAATCASLSAAAGLAIALMIEPLLPPKPQPSATPLPTKPPPVQPPPAVTAPTNTSPTHTDDQSASAHGTSAEAHGTLALGVVAVSRVLPRAAVGVTVSGSAQVYERLYAAVSASFLPEQHLRQDNADVGFGMTLASVGPCYRIPLHSNWSITSCVSLLVGSLEITVTSPEPIAPGARVWWAASTGLRLGWNSGPFEAALGIDALAHFTRHSYLIDRSEPQMSTSFFVESADAFIGSAVAGVRY
jgi:hypothetical protein